MIQENRKKIRYRHDDGKQLVFLLFDHRRDAVTTPHASSKRDRGRDTLVALTGPYGRWMMFKCFQTVWRHCFNDWTHLVSTVVLFHNVDKCWYCCLITMLKTAQLVAMLQPCSPWLRCVHSAMPNTCADFQSMATHYTRAPQLMSHTSSLVWLLTLYVLIIYGVISSFMVVYC